MNSNDLMREAILKYFYDLSKKALSMNRAKANELFTLALNIISFISI